MAYKIIVLAPAAGGKSSLVRYLRSHSDLHVAEIDEEILRTNNGEWPEDRDFKENVIVPKINKGILAQDAVVYFTYRIPTATIQEARQKGFKVLLLDVEIDELHRRNVKRMAEEKYEDISHWFEIQLKNYQELRDQGCIDKVIDGHQPTAQIAQEITALASV